MAGQLTVAYSPDLGFASVGATFRDLLPPDTPAFMLERVVGSATTATRPGIGRSSPGRICIYEYDSSNVHSVTFNFIDVLHSRLYGFSLHVFFVAPLLSGHFVASWAYVVP